MSLQEYYTVIRDGQEHLVRREHLTFAERNQIAAELERQALGKRTHANVLEAETERLIQAGRLSRAEKSSDSPQHRNRHT